MGSDEASAAAARLLAKLGIDPAGLDLSRVEGAGPGWITVNLGDGRWAQVTLREDGDGWDKVIGRYDHNGDPDIHDPISQSWGNPDWDARGLVRDALAAAPSGHA